MEERSAMRDLALLGKVSPGKWERHGKSVQWKTDRGYMEYVCNCTASHVATGDQQAMDNADFIIMAKDALPYWIALGMAYQDAMNRRDELAKRLEIMEGALRIAGEYYTPCFDCGSDNGPPPPHGCDPPFKMHNPECQRFQEYLKVQEAMKLLPPEET